MNNTKENLTYGFEQRIHDKAENIIKNDIYCNASYLINELSKNDEYIDDLMAVMVKDDYETALYNWWINADNKDKKDLLEYVKISDPNCNTIEDLLEQDCQDLCDYIKKEPYTKEALEFYIVSEWLADKLEAQGELVIKDFLGLDIWGRSCSGQAIILDGIIQRIVEAV